MKDPSYFIQMSTLQQPRVQELLERLFAEASVADAPLREKIASSTPEERTALMAQVTNEPHVFYQGLAKTMFLPVSRETGRLLYMLVRATKAKGIVEFGTSFGISTIHLTAAVKDNGGGRVIGSEYEAAKAARARQHLEAAGLSDFVEVRDGDATESLSRDLPERVDLLLLDGAKSLYPRILDLVEPKLANGALVLADNADHNPEFLARIRDPKNGYLSVPFAEDVELFMRLANA